MNEKKICFIMCVNNDDYMNEAISYIQRLYIPDGYETDLLTVTDAPCMTAGYNEAMQASDARYKVYMHQDVMIINRHFLFDLLALFSNKKLGMFGLVGTPKLAENNIMWYSDRIGQIYHCNVYGSSLLAFSPARPPYQSVEAIDGLLMATQYDIPWRDDVFRGWDFYDVSQSCEFISHGYEVGVPYMETPWVMHDDGFMDLEKYYHQRKLFTDTYRKSSP